MKTLLDYALEYAQLGWTPIPVRPKSKIPCLADWPNKASTDEAYLKENFTHHSGNIGIVCGEKSNLLVLDVDMPDGPAELEQLEKKLGKLPDTLSQTTGGGGKQFFFLYPAGVAIGNSVKKLGAGIDIRANKGQAVVPPSIHPNGNQYKWDNTFSPAALPQAWIEHLVQMETTAPPPLTPINPLSSMKLLGFILTSRRRFPIV